MTCGGCSHFRYCAGALRCVWVAPGCDDIWSRLSLAGVSGRLCAANSVTATTLLGYASPGRSFGFDTTVTVRTGRKVLLSTYSRTETGGAVQTVEPHRLPVTFAGVGTGMSVRSSYTGVAPIVVCPMSCMFWAPACDRWY